MTKNLISSIEARRSCKDANDQPISIFTWWHHPMDYWWINRLPNIINTWFVCDAALADNYLDWVDYLSVFHQKHFISTNFAMTEWWRLYLSHQIIVTILSVLWWITNWTQMANSRYPKKLHSSCKSRKNFGWCKLLRSKDFLKEPRTYISRLSLDARDTKINALDYQKFFVHWAFYFWNNLLLHLSKFKLCHMSVCALSLFILLLQCLTSFQLCCNNVDLAQTLQLILQPWNNCIIFCINH